MADSNIQWTDKVWNPVTGCSKVSAGCENCYAETMTKRLKGMGVEKYKNGFVPAFHPETLSIPSKWKKPCKIFVNSMSDLFHKEIPFTFINEVFRTIYNNKRHTFQILTKRPERIKEYFEYVKYIEFPKQFPNLWLGVSVENQETADERIPVLLATPAAVRFVSVEPMLGPVDLKNIRHYNSHGEHICSYQVLEPITNAKCGNRPALDWVICGGETGKNARECSMSWIITLQEQCQQANVPFFLKDCGEYIKKICKPIFKSSHIEEKYENDEIGHIKYKQFPEIKI